MPIIKNYITEDDGTTTVVIKGVELDNKVLALCSRHHKEQHQIGMDSFNEKYKLHDSWVSVDERLNRMLKGEVNGRSIVD